MRDMMVKELERMLELKGEDQWILSYIIPQPQAIHFQIE
jgi:hypothetical protein